LLLTLTTPSGSSAIPPGRRRRAVRTVGIGSYVLAAILAGLHLRSLARIAPQRKAHTFRSTVTNVDAKARTLTVNGEKVAGWPR
jgi:hypothetical protein